jgi:hypothetical protein
LSAPSIPPTKKEAAALKKKEKAAEKAAEKLSKKKANTKSSSTASSSSVNLDCISTLTNSSGEKSCGMGCDFFE